MKCISIHTRLCLLLLLGSLFFLPFTGGDAMSEGVWSFDNNIDSLTPYQDGVMLLEGGQLWLWNPDQPAPQKMGNTFFTEYKHFLRTMTGNCLR